MLCKIEQKAVENIKPTNVLPQTPYWGRLKDEQGFTPKGFEITVSKELLGYNSEASMPVQDDLLVLVKYLNDSFCYAYVPYGPKLEPAFENQGWFLEELSEKIKAHLPSNCIFIRYDLMWENQWAAEDEYFDEKGNWNGPPEGNIQEMRVNYKTSNFNLRKSASDILPKNTFFLNLTLDEKDLLANMRYNTRYSIKQAYKKGINVQEYGMERIQDWYELYTETAIRHNMPLQNVEFFKNILENQDNGSKGVSVKMLMADSEGEFLASMFLVLSDKRANYLYGASLPNTKMASYALQWESIKIAKKHGCTEYDMFGSAPNITESHPLRGVHIYKKGFGGNLYHRMGCWDYPFKQKEYDLFRLQEISN
ncbi:peptidoglycan bridge formation glycyltransferase FemA/FemB family protein [Galbibacter sp. BG1]|uniref:lipid II:glycine glycyltransferase FemX n=1 Tax=Galbibacter sp. BG1 TaxID=1170699 RepID=UPI0015BF32E3|nr:peptidoglycan bridge formation glycyltransferase FemA/FemB family protein [Galbibacter sp. BG1]QLE01091.1 peptidoglycan bridge formation glycyltransferase FemA/FemB family protein [Galbibacter sp. BG1]